MCVNSALFQTNLRSSTALRTRSTRAIRSRILCSFIFSKGKMSSPLLVKGRGLSFIISSWKGKIEVKVKKETYRWSMLKENTKLHVHSTKSFIPLQEESTILAAFEHSCWQRAEKKYQTESHLTSSDEKSKLCFKNFIKLNQTQIKVTYFIKIPSPSKRSHFAKIRISFSMMYHHHLAWALCP